SERPPEDDISDADWIFFKIPFLSAACWEWRIRKRRGVPISPHPPPELRFCAELEYEEEVSFSMFSNILVDIAEDTAALQGEQFEEEDVDKGEHVIWFILFCRDAR
ncbi:MAG: hypothetical protein GY696_14500, partial [Gammaproteobacteria bacterium]|nr:hypothetical protein [Gammaproteobacteria bacterium]